MSSEMCDFDDYNKPALDKEGDCVLYNPHIYVHQLVSESHSFPDGSGSEGDASLSLEGEEPALECLLARVNRPALAARASSLRQGVACYVPPLEYDSKTRSLVMGSCNIHLSVVFEDGVIWVARVRKSKPGSPPTDLENRMMKCEMATLKFLEKTSLPTPKVHDVALEGDEGNDVGVGYILMDKMPGKPLEWRHASAKQKRKVMDQMADVFIEVQKHPFDTIGSLREASDGTIEVGPIASEERSGPFRTAEDYIANEIQICLDSVMGRDVSQHEHIIDSFLLYRFLQDLTPLVLPALVDNDPSPQFYLRHGDDKGDHILVDEDFNITGIIDWEWADILPASHAFRSPTGFLRVGEFYDGEAAMCKEEKYFLSKLEEKGYPELAQHVRKGRVVHFFTFCCGYDLDGDFEGFVGLFKGLRESSAIDAGMEWEEWRAMAMEQYKSDSGLKTLLARCSELVASE